MSITQTKKKRPGNPRQETNRAAHNSDTHLGALMNLQSNAKPSTPIEITTVVLKSWGIYTIDDLARHAYQSGLNPADILDLAQRKAGDR